MTKAEFIERLENQFRGMIQGVRRRASAEIEGSRTRMDAQTFADWLRSEMEKANAEPALKVFDIVLRPFYSTPEDAARSLADFIEFDLCTFLNEANQAVTDTTRVNWKEQFESAAPILSNYRPEKSAEWKYRLEFTNYIAAAKAETRAGVFAAYITQAWPQGSILYQIGEGEDYALNFRADIMKRGALYYQIWNEYKEYLRNKDLTERDFLLCDIDVCNDEIERWKNLKHDFRDIWTAMLRANIRAHRERLEDLEKETTDKGKPKTQPARVTPDYDFDALFIEGVKDRFLKAAKKAGMIDSAEKWKVGPRRKWLIMAAWNLILNEDLQAPGIVHDYAACKAIAKKFGEKIAVATFYNNWSIGRERYLLLDGKDFYLIFEEIFKRE